jgi:hypothetical protein
MGAEKDDPSLAELWRALWWALFRDFGVTAKRVRFSTAGDPEHPMWLPFPPPGRNPPARGKGE